MAMTAPLPPALASPDAEEWERASNAALATDEPDTQRFTVQDTPSAEWTMRHVAKIEAELRAANEQAEEWRAQIDAWVDHETADLHRRHAYFTALLIDYQRGRREAGGSATLDLPSGRVSSIASGPSVGIKNDEAFIAWCEANGHDDLVRITKAPNKTAAKKALTVAEMDDGPGLVIDTDTGQPVPGAVVKPARLIVKVEPTT